MSLAAHSGEFDGGGFLKSTICRIRTELKLPAMATGRIKERVSFLEWCQQLSRDGLKVDGRPFNLDDRPAIRWVYEQIPSTPGEAFGKFLVVMKGAQTGFTVLEMLADLYMAAMWEPVTIGQYVPEMMLAQYKSKHRFMRFVRSSSLLREMMQRPGATGTRVDEGNVISRQVGDSRLLFLWTTGVITTESYPLDVVSLDEVQGMSLDQIDKVRERMSASPVRFTLMLSTPTDPNMDIHHWYGRGTQHRFWTACERCGREAVLTDRWPDCVQMVAGVYRYVCECGESVDPQHGEWKAKTPGLPIISLHYPQLLSPTVTAEETLTAWVSALTGTQKKNFYNRKLGLPYADPSEIPISIPMLEACAEEGRAVGLRVEHSGSGYYMGVDQMGQFNVATIKKRLPDGRQGVVWAEAIYDPDPFARCDVLMERYGVAVCVVESLPNYNDAKRFAGRHRGKVFLVTAYTQGGDEMLQWGDAVLTRADRQLDENERDRYTVTLNQYKCMQVSLARFQHRLCLFPDPGAIEQDVLENGTRQRVAVIRDMYWHHLTRVALRYEPDELDPKKRRYLVAKVGIGIDPHFAYANMLCDVAWARVHGANVMMMPEVQTVEHQIEVPGMTEQAREALFRVHEQTTDTCGACAAFDIKASQCSERRLTVRPADPACPIFLQRVP